MPPIGTIASRFFAAGRLSQIPVARLVSNQRTAEVVRWRHAAMHAAYAAGHTVSAIGRRASKDHTTVMHAVRRVEASEELRALAARIEQEALAPAAET